MILKFATATAMKEKYIGKTTNSLEIFKDKISLLNAGPADQLITHITKR